jgi:tol-pal system protein YbgF
MRVLALLLCSTLGTAAFAAVPVVESRGQPRAAAAERTTPRTNATPAPAAASASADVMPGRPVDVPEGEVAAGGIDLVGAGSAPVNPPEVSGDLVYQVQVLRQELQQLRGTLEEQQNRIVRMEREQQQRYLDVDRRLTAGGASTDGPPAPAGDGPAVSDRVAGVDAGERTAYAAAVQLTREKQFQPAIEAFNRQLTEYPDGAFSANAFYWLGELYLALPTPKLELARQSFAQVVNLYSDHPKVPDALYKLGVVYGKLGDRDAAERHMRRTRDEFPGTPAAGLAEAYLASPN